MKKTVVVCDTQPIAIEGLRALVASHHDLAVAGEATSMMAGMELVRNLAPSALVVDKAFGLQPVMDWISNLRSSGRNTAVVVWATTINEAEALRMVQAGAQGVIRKTASLRCVLDCLRMVAAGNTWMDELMFQNGDRTAGAGRSNLTTREQQVAELVEQGLKNKEIANALGICAGTVKIHLKHIFEKTGFAAVTAWRFPGSRNVVTCRRRVTTSAVPTLLAYVPHLRFAEHAGQRVAHVG